MAPNHRPLSGLVISYVVFAALLALSVAPAGPASQGASAIRVQDTVFLGGNPVTSFDAVIPPGSSFSNTTVFATLNASTTVVAASLNLTGAFQTMFVNLSGRGTTTDNNLQFGQGVHAADFNNDGIDDLAIGWEGTSASTVIAGRGVEVYYGSPQPLASRAFDWQWGPSNSATCGFGHSITHGDYNNDGIDDLVAGCGWEFWSGAPEVVNIFNGSMAGLPSEPSFNLSFNLTATSYGFGRALAGGLDINGDGYDDLVVAEPYYNGNRGRVDVFWGSPTGLMNTSLTQIEMNSTALYAETLAVLGDTDGDGLDEFAVGSPRNGSQFGSVEVYEGVANTTDLAQLWASAPTAQEYFGFSVAGGDDLTGDGIPDLVVGAPFRNTNGEVYLFAGVGNATYAGTATTMLRAQSGGQENLGIGADIIGDFDGDGKADLVIGGNRYNNWDGRFYLYTGQNYSASAAQVVNHNATGGGEELGWRVNRAGDLNNDGFDDFAVSVRAGHNGSFLPGNVFLYYGTGTPFPDQVRIYVGEELAWAGTGALSGNATAQGFGAAIQAYIDAHPGDVDGAGNIGVPISVNYSGGGKLSVSLISIRYSLVLPPTGVAVTAPPEGRSLTVQWNLHATDGSIFNVWSNASGSWQPVGTASLPKTSYTVTGLTDGVEYWFYLTETDPVAGLSSGASVTVSGIPQDTVAPATPLNFSLVPNPANHSARLSWSPNSDDAVAYQVWRKAGTEPTFSLQATVPHPTKSFNDTGLAEEVTYSYRIVAVDPASLSSAPTKTLSMTINDLTPPPVPQNVVARTATSGTGIEVSWDPNTADTVSYEVLFGTVNDTGSFSAFDTTADTSLTITGLNRDNTYYVAVRAIDKVAHRSGFSIVVGVLTVDTQAPFPPSLSSATPVATGNAVRLEWTSTDDDIDGFRVYSNDGGSWVEVQSVTAPATTTVVVNLTDGQQYEFRLAAFDLGGRLGNPSNSLTATPADTVRPGSPPTTTVEVVPEGGAITLTWTAPSDLDVAGYNIYALDPQGAGGFAKIATVSAATLTWTHSGLTNGLSYSYEVTAFDEVPNESPSGPRVVAVPGDTIVPDPPSWDPISPVTNKVSITVSGTAEPGTEVQVYLNGALRKTAETDSAGRFSADLILGPGENQVAAKAFDPDPAVAPQYRTSADSPVLRITLDTDRPTLAGRTPAENAGGVSVRTRISLTFTEAVAPTGFSIVVKDSGDNAVAGTVALDPTGRTAEFVPSEALAEGTTYTVTIVGTDLAGNAIDVTPYTFTTEGTGPGGSGDGGLPGLGAPAALAAIALLGAASWAARRSRREG